MHIRERRSPAVQALKKGQEVEIKIEKLVLGGMGLGLLDTSTLISAEKLTNPEDKKPLRVFVERALPGQIVRVAIHQKKPRYVMGKIVQVVQESPLAVKAKCPYFADSKKINDQLPSCGGCLWQNLEYSEQLKVKQEQVFDTLTRIGKIQNLELDPIVPSPDPWSYRNKIELSFGYNQGGHVDFGFRERGQFHSIIPVESCDIFDPKLPAVLDVIRRYVRLADLEPYDFAKRPDGFWQFLIVRRGVKTGEWMINFITRPGHKIPKHLAEELQEVLGDQLQSVLQTTNFGKAISYMGHPNKKVEVLFGRDYILEELGGLRFKISPFSFFQTNTLAAEKLYETVKEFAQLKGHEKILDMYCGTGTIGQYLARHAREVIGMEILEEAIQDANENARINTLANCSYKCGDVDKILFTERNKYLHIDMIILDPPRAGISQKTLKKILSLMPQSVVYVSCNPATLARDLISFRQRGYVITRTGSLDLFPQTHHVETVVRLERQRNVIG